MLITKHSCGKYYQYEYHITEPAVCRLATMGIGLFSDGFLEDRFFGSRIIRNKRVVEKTQKEQKKNEEKEKGELSLGMIAEGKVDYSKKSDLGFMVFKLQKSNFPRVEYAPNPELSDEENIELLKKHIKEIEAQLVSAFSKDELTTKIHIKNDFKLNYILTNREEFKKMKFYLFQMKINKP